MLIGGYVNVEGGPDTTPLDSVDILTLDQEAQFANSGKWCSMKTSSMPTPLDTAAVAWVDTWKFTDPQVNNSRFTSAHYTTSWTRVLVCGGGDSVYNVTNQCWWYNTVQDSWRRGPRMLEGRFEAVAVSLPGPSNNGGHHGGQVWITGGREGSNILQNNEVLQYPGIFSDVSITDPGYTLKRWQWANEKAKHTDIWNYAVRESMYELPIPLSGHCVVVLNDKMVVFLGGGTTKFKEEDGSVIPMTGPIPSDHVHSYNLDSEAWSTTVPGMTITNDNYRRMKVARMNHGCVRYNQGGTKIMVAGGVRKTASGQFEVTDSVEVMDWNSKTWRTERVLPRKFTGLKMIATQNAPTMLGNYNFEKQNLIFRYDTANKLWIPLSAKLETGKSDFGLLELPSNFKHGVHINPNMNSGETKISPGNCATRDWRNKFNLIKEGEKVVWRTGLQTHPWIQLDMMESIRITKESFI